MGLIRSFITKVNDLILRRIHRGENSNISIQVSDYGIIISDEKDKMQIAWNDITKIVAFKRDLYAVDVICIAIERNDGVCELNEEMKGFSDLFGFMEKNLYVSPSWYIDIMTPAFATNMIIIYEKRRS